MSKIWLPPELQAFAEGLVASGRYVDVSHAVAAGVELLRDAELVRETRRAELLAKIEEGLADIREGRVYDADEVFRELEEMLDDRPRKDAAE